MMCEICGEQEAVLHIQEIVDKTRKEIHICKACAEARGIFDGIGTLDFSLESIIGGTGPEAPEAEEARVALTCSVCGYDLSMLQERPALGCPECYHDLGDLIAPMLEELHPHVKHVGRRPGEKRETKRRLSRIKRLSQELKRLIATEQYEKAAALRDKLTALESEDGTGAKPKDTNG